MRRLAALAILLLTSCAPKQPADLRLRIAPLENLSQELSLDWEGRIAPFILTTDLSGVPHLIASGSDPRANRALEGYFDLDGDRLAVHATLEDPRQPKTLQVIVREGPKSAGIVPLLDQIAKQINPAAHAFPSPDPAALETFSEAMSSEDPGTRLRLFQTATVQNPKFAPAFLALAESRLAAGDRPGAAEAATRGKAVSANPIEQTEFDYLAATAHQDLAARERAMQELVRLTPDDVQAIRTLAEIHAAQRRFQDAARGYEEIARLEPNDPLTYNVLGYMDGYAHDLAGARAALEKYKSLTSATDLNATDSLGEVYFYNGDFANAENQFLAAHEFLKAAEARLMTGDLSGADGLFEKSMAKQPERELERAQWEFLTGRRKQAMARVEKLVSASGDAGAVATAQLSFWHLQTGDRAGATQLATTAFAHATSPAIKNLAAICRFLSQSPAGKSQFANINALALMLNHQFAEAVPILEMLLGESNPATDAQVRTLLAWAYVETGKTAQAKPLVDLYIIPLPSAEPAFVSLIFPRFLQVRATVLSEQPQLYDKLKGDLPDRF